MAADNRRGLGRGLSALLDEAGAAAVEGTEVAGGWRETPIELIRRNPEQPRRDFAEADIEQLADSIRERGVLQPILVRPAPGMPGEYQIVAGERRWRAAQRAGLRHMPVVVRELDDLAAFEIAIIENVQRADLNPIEEALGYKTLIERFGRTQEAVAQTVGKSRSHVANALRLLALPESMQADLRSGRLSAGHARALAGAPDAAALAGLVIDKGLSVREAEALARRAHGREAEPAARKSRGGGKDADTRALEEDLSEALGLDVEVADLGGAGEVRIRYANLEQLDDVCRRLTRS
ncbi:MAG: ParB/RepB/Spo0J family partition protein [Caulobacteraceae bacterium]|nr:ParB/RepB/Spo0J family partition protein [Caulobacteraceae bacterium]